MKRTRDATKAPPATRRQRKEKVPAMREVEVGEEEEEKEHESAAATLPLPSIAHTVSARLHLPAGGVRYVLEQTRRGATLPFLARYRRDETCGMMEDQLRQVIDTGEEVAAVHRRRQFMLRSLAERHLLTDELRQHLEKLVHLSQLEDAWEPFKLKRSSLAARGREAGLATWAEHLLQREEPINLKELHAALHAVEDGERLLLAIVSEELQRCEVLRQGLLESYQRTGSITSSVVANARKKVAKDLDDRDFAKLQKHFTFYDKKSFGVQRVSSHIVLALARGEAKGVLKVDLDRHTRNGVYDFQRVVEQHFPGAALRLGRRPNNSKNSITARERELLRAGMDAAYAHLNKAVQTTIRRDLQKSAEREAIIVFAHNVEHMLLQRPMANARVLAMDPGLANGIKCVALDSDGSVLTYFTGNFLDEPKLRTTIAKLVEVKGLNKIVIGNGTASQRTTQLVADVLRQQTWADVEFAVVSEAGASVYSVSDIAKEEFPSLDAMYRGAISIGRRVLDPLSELVKIPVRSMGIGMYQHDLHEKELNKALHRVVESCVARVGVNAESSSRYVMEKVPGITKKLVDQIVLARHAEKLRSRDDLRRVPGMTEPMFQQIAGFFRFPNSAEPLDNTHLHPEMYEVVRHLLTRVARGEVCGSTSVPSNTSDTSTNNSTFHAAGAAVAALSEAEAAALAARVGCGLATLRLVADELQQPGLDPRASLPHAGYLRRTLLDAKQLQPGAELEGVVQSVTTFGSFVDVGLHDAVLVRGEEAMRWQPGILVRQIIFTGRDELGRLRVDYKGPTSSKGSIRDRLRLEWEDALEEEEGCTNTKRAREPPTTATTTTTSATTTQTKEVDEPAAKRVRQAEPCAPPPPPSSSEEEELEEFAI